ARLPCREALGRGRIRGCRPLPQRNRDSRRALAPAAAVSRHALGARSRPAEEALLRPGLFQPEGIGRPTSFRRQARDDCPKQSASAGLLPEQALWLCRVLFGQRPASVPPLSGPSIPTRRRLAGFSPRIRTSRGRSWPIPSVRAEKVAPCEIMRQ